MNDFRAFSINLFQRFIIAVLTMSPLKTFVRVTYMENTSITSFETPIVLEQSFLKN